VGYLTGAWAYILNNWGDWSAALVRQIQYSLLSLVIAMAICIPLGILASRSRIVSFGAVNLFGTARSIPSIAILFLMIPIIGFGFTPVLIALIVLACPPILVNTLAGFAGVDPAVVEAARGMALPVVLAGVRTAALEVIASATLATFVAGGGFGDFITQGIDNGKIEIALAGALPVALIALCAEALFSGLQRVVSPTA